MDDGDTASYDDVGDDIAVEDGGGATTPVPEPPVMAVVLAISRMKRPGAPRVPRPRRRRAVVPGAVGSGHGARRTKVFLQWREWYLREKRRERELARWYHIGIPPA